MYKKKTFRNKIQSNGIDPDEVLLDASNLPDFNTTQFEGRVERSIQQRVPLFVGIFSLLIVLGFLGQAWHLQVAKGASFLKLSTNNRLDHDILFANRGIIYDRYKRKLAWNVPQLRKDVDASRSTFTLRQYIKKEGFSILLGFVGYPKKDKNGYWWRKEYKGKAGVESNLNDVLNGVNGVTIVEVNARNEIQSSNIINTPIDGKSVLLNIDSALQESLFKNIKNVVNKASYVGGAGVIMDVHTGAVLALTSYPEYSSQVMTNATDVKKIQGYAAQKNEPFLDRAVLGEYAPGSIVKPYVAAAVLQENLISPLKKILSTGEIRVPNPYDPTKYTVFKDWKAHGWVNMRDAIAVSSDVYFYTVGGGFGNQKGLGIERLAAYATRFGFGTPTGIELNSEAKGIVPTPAWKRVVFGKDNPWRIGNTYHTSIGQFGFLVTPIQAVRYISAIANGGTLVSPHLVQGTPVKSRSVAIDDKNLQIVREGMLQAVKKGVIMALDIPGISIAAKTGTAQVGVGNAYINSWLVGFWPMDNPKFAFAIVLGRAPDTAIHGSVLAMRDFFLEMVQKYPATYARGVYPKGGKY